MSRSDRPQPEPPSGPELKDKALRLLARRDHSRAELARKLAPEGDPDGVVAALLDELERRGWLSERRVAEQVVRKRSTRYGPRMVAAELRRKGVGDEAIEAATQELRAGQLAAARAVWSKRFKDLPRTAQARAQQARFLEARGFDREVIVKVLRGVDEAEA